MSNLVCQKGAYKVANYKEFDTSKKVLITGGAGFIGFQLSRRLLELGQRWLALITATTTMMCR